MYAITPAGRRALRAWLRTPGDWLVFECEAAVKAFFGDAGNLGELQAQLRALAGAIATIGSIAHRDTPPAAQRDIRFPGRLHYTAMSADLIARLRLTVTKWAADWADSTEEWSTVHLDDASGRQAVAVLDERIADIERALTAGATPTSACSR